MKKILTFILENTKNSYVLGAISAATGIIYFFDLLKNTVILIIFIISVVFFVFSLGRQIYIKIKQVRQKKKNEEEIAQNQYLERFESVKNIYESLNKDERQIYYDLFYNKEKIISKSNFYFCTGIRTDTFLNITSYPFFNNNFNIYGEEKQYILRCTLIDTYTDEKGNQGFENYRFTMDPFYRSVYKEVIEQVKRIIETNE